MFLNIKNRSRISKTCHEHKSSPSSVTNIDEVCHDYYVAVRGFVQKPWKTDDVSNTAAAIATIQNLLQRLYLVIDETYLNPWYVI